LIRELQKRQAESGGISQKSLVSEFNISMPTLKKYIRMTEEDIQALDRPHFNNRNIGRVMDDYVNIIYKMLRDGIDISAISHYVRRKGFSGDSGTIWQYIQSIALWNFPERGKVVPTVLLKWKYPDDVIVIKRTALLKYILTVNPKTKKDETISEYIDIVKAKFPVVEIARNIFISFHSVLMGGNADALDGFLDRYDKSEIASFCDGIKQDIVPIRNAISMSASSGFVEGGNNKFKLIKREMYGRANLPYLTQKCLLGFSIKKQDFNLFDLI
jgi:hypothetical protein